MTETHEIGICIIAGAFVIFFSLLMGAIMWSSDSKVIAIIFCAMFVSIGTMIIIPRAEELNEISEVQSIAMEQNNNPSLAVFESEWIANCKATNT